MTNRESKPKIILICGPTGVGKTSLSLSLAQEFRGGIVSADSMQIYRHMDIGTAKPGPKDRSRILHYMIDVLDPDEPYDAAGYARDAREAIFRLCDQGMVPFVVGGTGFYIRALLNGLFAAKSADPEIRGRLKEEAARKGGYRLYERLGQCDPVAAERIHQNDVYRIIRALEVYEITGRPMSSHQQRHGFMDSPFKVLKVCLTMDRQALYERINRRVDQMVAAGLLNEVKQLLDMGYSEDLRPMQAIGYRHMTDYINGHLSWEEAVDTLKQDTRRYAKRQLTWFKKDREMIWQNPADAEQIRSLIRRFLMDLEVDFTKRTG